MAFDLDSLTVDPAKRTAILQENNTAIKQYSKNAQAQLTELQQTNRDLREIESSEFMVDKIADQQAASNILNLVDASQSALSGMDGSLRNLENTMATQVARLADLQDILSRPNDLDPKDLKQAEKEFKKLDEQAFKTQNTLIASRNERAAIQQSAAQAIEQYSARHAISKQARDNNEQVARTMTLKNQQQAMLDKLKQDETLVGIINSRQTLSPGEVDQNTRDGMDVFKFMYFTRHNGENMDKYGVAQARQEQALFSALSPDEQRAAMMASRAFTVAEVTGVPLNIGQYKEQIAESGEAGALEIIAKLSGDTDVVDALNTGRNAMFSNMYDQAVAAETASLSEVEKIQGLSDQRLRQIRMSVQQQIQGLQANDVLEATQAVVNQDINNTTQAKGQEILSKYTESGVDELLSPLIFSPQIREYFNSPEAKDVMGTPNMSTGNPLLETSAKLVQSMQRKGFSGPDATTAVANLLGQAAKASYKTRSDFGTNPYSLQLQTLERLGYSNVPPVLVPPPSTRSIPANRAGVANYNLANPTDLQAAIAYNAKFIRSREVQKQNNTSINAAVGAVARGAPVSQYGLPVYQPNK